MKLTQIQLEGIANDLSLQWLKNNCYANRSSFLMTVNYVANRIDDFEHNQVDYLRSWIDELSAHMQVGDLDIVAISNIIKGLRKSLNDFDSRYS